MNVPMIRGAGGSGGGKSGGGAYVQPDSLASRAYAQVMDLLCEGEVEGLVGGMQGVYLDGVPMQNPNGSMNFSGVSFAFVNGTQVQDWIPGFGEVDNTTPVGLEVRQTTPIVRTITDTEVNAVRVVISVPQLAYTNLKNGDVTGTPVQISISVDNNGGGYVQRVNDTISGKASSNFQKQYLIGLGGSGPWNIQVSRLTQDHDTFPNIEDKIVWDAYTEVIFAKLTYPNSAIAALQVDSAQFQTIPQRLYHMKLLIVSIPSNYDPIARTYAGAWDGTFKVGWSNNPAWCFYDLLTNPRYGLGQFVLPSQVDKWALYQIAQYCDQLVPDGFGGMEPRFSCNVYIRIRQPAFKVVQDMASVFRGMPFWSTGTVSAVQDAPAYPAALFTNANVIGGDFTYTGSSLKSRHTIALVTWNNMADLGKQYVEYVGNDALIQKYGAVLAEVTAFGCTSRGQAHRVGQWLLYSEQYEGETVSFKVGLDAAPVRPGDIIKVSDSVRAGQRMGGRIAAATPFTATLDSDLVDNNGNQINPIGGTLNVITMDNVVVSPTVQQVIPNFTLSLFTRASPGTYIDQNGVMQTAPNGVPRFDWTTGSPVLLQEGASANYALDSGSVGGANWYTAGVTAQANALTAPDGTQTATLVTASASGSFNRVGQGVQTSIAQCTSSFFVKRGTVQWAMITAEGSSGGARVWFDLVNQVVGTNSNYSGASVPSASIKVLSNGYLRLSMTMTPTASQSTSFYLCLCDGNGSVSSVAGETLYVWGGDCEDASYATSYIATEGTPIARFGETAQFAVTPGKPTLVVTPAFNVASQLPASPAIWTLDVPTLNNQQFRIIQIMESEPGELTITGLTYNASKYNAIEDGAPLTVQQITDLTTPPPPPSSILVQESLYSFQSTVFSMAEISWPSVSGAIAYTVAYSKDNGSWIYQGAVPSNAYTINKADPGSYDIRVWSIGSTQRASLTYAETVVTLFGKQAPPSDVTGLTYGFDASLGLILSWAAAPDIDIASYEIRLGPSWNTAAFLARVNATEYVVGTNDAIDANIFQVKILDTQGVYSTDAATVSVFIPQATPLTLTGALVGSNVVLSWNKVVGPLNIDHYEVRQDASFGTPGPGLLGTVKGTTYSLKAQFAGAKTFGVAAVDIGGNYVAIGYADVTVSLPAIASVNVQVVDNNVLLQWSSQAGTLPIDHYKVSSGPSYSGSTLIGNINGLFSAIFETQAGSYTYWIVPVDVAGNQGTPYPTTAAVNPPPNYVLHFNLNSVFAGAIVNGELDAGILTMPVDTTTSYQAHFTNEGWASPSAQVAAGDALFIEPSPGSGTYTETIDYGAILSASQVTATPTVTIAAGAPTIAYEIQTSPDNTTFTTYSGLSAYVTNFRYLRFIITVTGGAGDIAQFSALNIKYQVKQKQDFGSIVCNASDTNGSPATFNISFIDVQSISVTPAGTSGLVAVYDFNGAPDPTGFTIYLFNSSTGARASGTVSWTANGV